MKQIYSDRVRLLINLILNSKNNYTLEQAREINKKMLELINLLIEGEKDDSNI